MKTSVAIVGGGPAGTTSSMYLSRLGIDHVIVEKVAFPRYHIGESMTGECGAVVRDLGLEPQMLAARYPQKKGVNVYGPKGLTPWFVPVMARDENWQLQEQFTWQVRRSDYDQMMLEEAAARGATVIAGQATRPLVNDDGSVRGIEIRPADGGLMEIEAELVLDCSGQATLLAGAGVTGPKYLGNYDKQIAIFSQVTDTIRDGDGSRLQDKDNTLIFYQKKYHWAWSIPLDEDVVSVGVVVPSAYFLETGESKRDFLVRELRELNPELARRIPEVKLVEDVHVVPNYSFQVRDFCGRGYMCIGDSHRFLDPIFSFGLYVAMKEAQFAAPVIKAYLEGAGRDQKNPFAEYQIFCEQGIDVLEDMLDAFWEQPFAFASIVHSRHVEQTIDAFAGRIYERQPSEATHTFRRLLKRERTYDDDGLYSVPIGSRYHPERAPLWEANSPIQSTEAWLGPG